MNSVFNLKRTGWLIKQHFIEYKLTYLILLITVLIVDLFFLNSVFFLFDPEGNELMKVYLGLRISFFILSVVIGGITYFYSLTRRLETKERQIDDFKLPNSIFEKCFVNILNITLATITITLMFWGVDYLVCHRLLANSEVPVAIHAIPPFNPFEFIYAVYLIFFFVGSIFLGFISHTFKRKTRGILVVIGLFIAILLINYVLNGMFFYDLAHDLGLSKRVKLPFQNLELKHIGAKKWGNYIISNGITRDQILLYFMLPITIFTVLIYYFRLKEKEI